ncbi:MAG: carbon storage regulator [Pirellulaceae bacterium]
MLVLSRKEGQDIVLGDNIVVRVMRTQGNRVQIGIEAPADVRITRGELAAKPSVEAAPANRVAEVFPRIVQAG